MAKSRNIQLLPLEVLCECKLTLTVLIQLYEKKNKPL